MGEDEKVIEKKELTLTITLNSDGQVGVTGPIGDKLICYGLLEVAKETIKDFNKKMIEKPSGSIMNFVRNRIGG